VNIHQTIGPQTTIEIPTSSKHVLWNYGERFKDITYQIGVKMNKHPDIKDNNLNNHDHILVIYSANIPDKSGHEMTIKVPTSLNVCFCTTCAAI